MKNYLRKNLNFAAAIFLMVAGTLSAIAQPLVANAGISPTICSGSSAVIGGSPTASYGTGPYTYSWTPAASLNNAAVANPQASPTTTTTYTVIVTDAVSATSNSIVTVTVKPAPTVTVPSNPSVCAGSIVAASAFTSNPVGATYTWTNSNTSIGLAANGIGDVPSFTATNATTINKTGIITVTPTLNGCTGPNNIYTIQVKPMPNPTANNNGPVCAGSTLNLTSGSGVAGTTYSWSGPNGFTSPLQNPSIAGVSIPAAGTYTVTGTAAGCSNLAATNVIVNPNPIANAGPDITICSGGSSSIGAAAVGGVSYSWSPTAGLSSSTISNPIATLTNGGTTPIVTTYTVTATNSTTGCTSIDQVNVTTNPIPSMTSASSATVCSGVTLNIPFTSSVASTYSWIAINNVNTTGESTTAQSSSTLNNTILNSTVSAQTVSYTVTPTSLAGCPGSNQTVAITVNPAPVMTSSNSGTVCSGTAINIPLSSNIPSSFTWIATNNVNTSGESTTSQSGGTINNTVINSTGTSQTVSYTVTPTSSAGSCMGATQMVNVIVNPMDNASFNYTGSTFCQSGTNPTPTITGLTGGTFSSTPAGLVINASTGQINVAASILGSYTITYTTPGPCSNFSSQTVSITPAPVTTFSYSPSAYCANAANPSPTFSGGGTAGTFSSTAGLVFVSTSTGQINLASTTPGTYTVTNTIAASGGCAASSSTATITIKPLPVITNTVTNVSCNGACNGSISASVTGGTPSYTYAWTPSGGGSPIATSLCAGNYTVTVSDANGCTAIRTSTVTQPNALNAAITSTNATCFGACNGTATGTALGGVPPYTYLWMPGNIVTSNATSLCAGTYTLTVTDGNGCTKNSNVTITQPAGLFGAINSQTNVQCFGASDGSVTIVATGGTAPYTFSINGGGNFQGSGSFSSLPAGSYTIIVKDANGCTSNTPATITQPTLLNASTSSTNVTCFGACNGTANGIASGGTLPYTYLWTPSSMTAPNVTSLCPGTYNFTVTDANGCSKTTITTITEPAAISTNPTITNASCNGVCNGSVNVSPTGGVAPYTYLWPSSGQVTPNIASLCAGVYSVDVRDANGCTITDNFIVNQPTSTVITTTSFDPSCNGVCDGVAASTPSGGSAPYSYMWTKIPTGTFVSNTQVASALCAGMYRVIISDFNGCTNSDTVTLLNPTSTISGNVTYSGGALSSGTNIAVLYKRLPIFTTFDTVLTTTLDALGNYQFTSVDSGSYLVKIFPDTSVLAYSGISPTYYGNDYLWDSASVIIQGCNSSNIADIAMLENSFILGPGNVSGSVLQGPGFGRAPGGPVPGIDIKLGRNPGGQLVLSTQTDPSDGTYTFENVPVNTNSTTDSSYTVYVDIPGLQRVAVYTFKVTAGNNQFTDLNYYVDSVRIYIDATVGINNYDTKENNFSLYPNPTKDASTIEYTLTKDSKVSIEIFNVVGVKVMVVMNSKQSEGSYKININTKSNNLNSGIYFIRLVKDGKLSTKRLVITE